MRKGKKNRKLSRKRDQRKALLKSLLLALFIHEKMETTEAKAKETARFAEKMITRAKENNLTATRYLARYFTKAIVKKMIVEVAPRYKDRKGGCTRIIKTGQRPSDGARMAIIELVK